MKLSRMVTIDAGRRPAWPWRRNGTLFVNAAPWADVAWTDAASASRLGDVSVAVGTHKSWRHPQLGAEDGRREAQTLVRLTMDMGR
jgi:hypothetical protein